MVLEILLNGATDEVCRDNKTANLVILLHRGNYTSISLPVHNLHSCREARFDSPVAVTALVRAGNISWG